VIFRIEVQLWYYGRHKIHNKYSIEESFKRKSIETKAF